MPADFGTPGTRTIYIISYGNIYGPYGPYTGSWPTYLAVRKTFKYTNPVPNGYIFYIYDGQGAFEFDLVPVNTIAFTSKNFYRHAQWIECEWFVSNLYSVPMHVDLFDMGNGAEDGNVYYTDFNSTRGSRIARSALEKQMVIR